VDQQVNIRVRLSYIHAEKISEIRAPQIQFQIQITVPSGEVRASEQELLIPYAFNLNSVPPILNVTLKGDIVVYGDKDRLENLRNDIKKRKIPKELIQAATQYTMFEAMLLARELGIPPPIPLPAPGPSRKPPSVTPI